MIAKMKKYTFMVYHKEYEDFLSNLRDLGMLHIVAKPFDGEDSNEELQERMTQQKNMDETIRFLEKLNSESKESVNEKVLTDCLSQSTELVDYIASLRSRLEKLEQQKASLSKACEEMEPWGDFSFQQIEKLKEAGYELNFFTYPISKFKDEWVELFNAQVIANVQSIAYFITITPSGTSLEIDAEKAKIPTQNLSSLQSDHAATLQESADVIAELKDIAAHKLATLKTIQAQSIKDFSFSKIVFSTERLANSKLMLLESWAPADRQEEIIPFLDKQAAYYEEKDPTPDDNVPILLKNDRFSRLFEPICKLYMLPKYSELDLTPFFAPFFMVFFGLCLGDSGYGLFMVLAALAYRFKAKNLTDAVKSILSLVLILGTSTLFCGLLTGTVFGASIYDLDIPVIQSLKETFYLDNNQMFNMSLIMGGIQIIFGMTLKTANRIIQFGWIHGVSTIGWIVLLVSTIVAATLPDILPMMGTVHSILLGISAIAIFLLNSPGKNILVNIGLGLWDSYNMATGLLGDILSYVRLFALGLSGGILASVFNSLAVGMSPDNVIVGPIIMAIIFVIGHGINLFMNVLGAVVHPMRLTFVEFFKNAEYEGGGREYTPFKN